MEPALFIWIFIIVLAVLALIAAIWPVFIKPPRQDDYIFVAEMHTTQKLFVVVFNLVILWAFLVLALSAQVGLAMLNLGIGVIVAFIYASPFDIIQKVRLNTLRKELIIRDFHGEKTYPVDEVKAIQLTRPGKMRIDLTGRKLTIPHSCPGSRNFVNALKEVKNKIAREKETSEVTQ